jgi:PPIC-type PPIASE domain/SurA N-terminal domain
MPNVSRIRASRALAAAALVGVALALSACVSDSSRGAFSAPTPSPAAGSPVPTVRPAPTMPPIPRNKPAAVVAGRPISGAAYADTVAQLLKAVAQRKQQQPGTIVPTERQIRSQALNSLIDTAVIDHYAQQHAITATAHDVQRRYDVVQTQIAQQALQTGQPITFTDVLAQYGYTVASFKKALADGIVRLKVESRIAPPGLVDAVRARHILIGPPLAQTGSLTPTTKAKPDSVYKAEAMAIDQQLKKDPRRFPALARQKSVDTGSGAQGGELGWFTRGMMVPPFEKAAFSLPVGRISPPVKSSYGYHIMQVEEHKKIPFTALPQSAQQTPAVQALLQLQQTQFQTWLSAERKRDHVRILAQGVS